jgi:hypothetical protein
VAKREPKRIESELSSGNVFADLGLPDAEQLKIESRIVIERIRAARLAEEAKQNDPPDPLTR